MTPKYLYLDGDIVPYEDAKIHILSPAITYAASVFEGIRGYWNANQEKLYIFRLDDHLKRLQYSMRVLRFDREFTIEELREPIFRLIEANGFRQDIHVRVLAYLGGVPRVQSVGPVGIAIQAGPFWPNPHIETGMTCMVSSWTRTHDNAIPPRVKATPNYANSRLAVLEAERNGYDSAILLNRSGKVAESPVANFFMVRDGIPVTPRVSDGILESITRDTLIRLLDTEMGHTTDVRGIDRTELYAAEEAFVCGSGWEITPVISIDQLAVGDGKVGPMTREIQAKYMSAVRNELRTPQGWITPVDF